jgi:hypothetical protein
MNGNAVSRNTEYGIAMCGNTVCGNAVCGNAVCWNAWQLKKAHWILQPKREEGTFKASQPVYGNTVYGNAVCGNAVCGNAVCWNALCGNAVFLVSRVWECHLRDAVCGNAEYGNVVCGNALCWNAWQLRKACWILQPKREEGSFEASQPYNLLVYTT